MTPGGAVRVLFPGHVWHGQLVRVVEVCPAFNLAPEDAEPVLAEVIFVQHPDAPYPCGVPRRRLRAAESNIVLRPTDVSRERQTELSLL